MLDSKRDSRLLESFEEHRIAIDKSTSTETKAMHKRGGENGSVTCMTVTQETLE